LAADKQHKVAPIFLGNRISFVDAKKSKAERRAEKKAAGMQEERHHVLDQRMCMGAEE